MNERLKIKKQKKEDALFGARLRFLPLLIFAAAFTGALYGQFDDLGTGARAVGMGGAFTGISDDVYAIRYNPAGLSRIDWKELGIDYSKLYWGLDDNSKLGSGFVGYAFRFDDFTKYKLDGTLGFGWQYFSLSGYYSENSFTFAYSRYIVNSGERKLSAGLNLKILSKSFGQTLYTENAVDLDNPLKQGPGRDPVFGSGYSKVKPSYDLGILWEINRHNSLGAVLADFTQPDMGMKSKDKVPMAAKFGYAYTGRDLGADCDFIYKDTDLILALGMEKWLLRKAFALRGGLGVGSREYANLAFGMSWKYSGLLRFDYSFNYPLSGMTDFYGSHRMSVNMKFGAPGIEEIVLEDRIRQLEAMLGKVKTTSQDEAARLKEERKKLKKELTKKDMKKYWDLGMLYYRQENFNPSIEQFENILSLAPNHKKALKMIEKVKEAKKKMMKEYWTAAMEYYRRGEYEKCIPQFEAILKLEPQHAQSKRILERIKNIVKKSRLQKLWQKGVFYYKNGSYENAIAEFNKILAIDPQHPQSKKFIRKAQKKLSAREEKRSEKTKAGNAAEAEKFYTEGLKAYSSGDLENAIEKLKKAEALSPDSEEIRNALINARKEWDVREGMKKDVQKWYNDGMRYYLQEDYDGAIGEFEKILEVDPGHPQAKEMIEKCRAKKK